MAVLSYAEKYQVKARHRVFISPEEGLEFFLVPDGALLRWALYWHGVDLLWNHGNPIQKVFFSCAEVAVWVGHRQTAFIHPEDMHLVPREAGKMRLFGQQPVQMSGRRPTGNGQGEAAPQADAFLGASAPYVRALSGHVSGTHCNDDFGSDAHILLSICGEDAACRPIVFAPIVLVDLRDDHAFSFGGMDEGPFSQENTYMTGIARWFEENEVSCLKLMPLYGDALFDLFLCRTRQRHIEGVPVDGSHKARAVDPSLTRAAQFVPRPFPLPVFISNLFFYPLAIRRIRSFA